jgi:hypothetical protein
MPGCSLVDPNRKETDMKRSLLLVLLSLLALAAALPAAPAHPAAKAAAPAACAAAPAPAAVALGLLAPAPGQKAINCTLFCESKNCPAGTTCGLDGKTNKCACI